MSSHDRSPPAIPILPLLGAIALIVVTTVGWVTIKAWQNAREKLEVARSLTAGDPGHAPDLVTRYGCGGCHTIAGLPGADGKAAPPLTDMRERVYIGGVLPNTAENLIDWIVDPRQFDPRTAMPASGITRDEARDIAAYLYTQ